VTPLEWRWWSLETTDLVFAVDSIRLVSRATAGPVLVFTRQRLDACEDCGASIRPCGFGVVP